MTIEGEGGGVRWVHLHPLFSCVNLPDQTKCLTWNCFIVNAMNVMLQIDKSELSVHVRWITTPDDLIPVFQNISQLGNNYLPRTVQNQYVAILLPPVPHFIYIQTLTPLFSSSLLVSHNFYRGSSVHKTADFVTLLYSPFSISLLVSLLSLSFPFSYGWLAVYIQKHTTTNFVNTLLFLSLPLSSYLSYHSLLIAGSCLLLSWKSQPPGAFNLCE